MIRQLDERVMVSGQVAPHEIAGLAEQGVTVLVNNRPDGEEAGQPLASEIEDAAAAAGISYRFVPILRGIGPADVEEMQKALRDAEGGKLLAFCRSGTRSALALGLAQREEGAAADDVIRRLQSAGFDPGPIAHLL
jgi:uncharacterized protein (TIGR01244 family)